MTDLNLSAGPAAPVIDGGGTLAFSNPQRANDGDPSSTASRGFHSGSTSPVTLALIADLGASHSVDTHTLYGALYTGFNDTVVFQTGTTIAGPWTTVTPTAYVTGGTGTTQTLTYEHTPTSARYWRMLHTRTHVGLYGMGQILIRTWEVLEYDAVVPVADFSASATTVVGSAPITFTDLSTNTPTSWLWDFGDGNTSTLQDPVHSYATTGSFTVSLTATNAAGSDTETKTLYVTVTADVGYETPTPAGALLEIYASEPGSARWGIAHWGEDVWSQAGWQNVTPEGVTVDILWGSDQAELGILGVPTAASWAIEYYDPTRLLDPSNVDSPYYGDLIPGLPIRLSHRGTIVRVGYATAIGHAFGEDPLDGYMRGTDNISRMANAQVPSDSTLADSLYSRATDAIAAAGLSIHVRPPRPANPAVSPWITGEREWSVWEWIVDAAREVHYIPFIDRLGNLDFRPWAEPLVRGRSVNSDEMVELQAITDYAGLYSVVRAREDEDTMVERALTPPPRYGARVFTRDEITIDPGDWADVVLADRAMPSLRWEPGSIRPLTANSTESLATLENVERISISVPEENPAINITGIVVGGEIFVRGKVASEAIWRFNLALAQTADEPLIESGGGPTDYLLATGGDQFLYPSS